MNGEGAKERLTEVLRVLDELGIDRESRLAASVVPLLIGGETSTMAAGAQNDRGDSMHAGVPGTTQSNGPDTAIGRLSEWSGVDPLVLEDAIYEEDDQVVIQVNSDRLPSSRAGIQRALAFAYFAVMRQGFGVTDVPADHFNDLLREYGALDQNVWANLHSEMGAFGRRGDRGSYTYRLTIQGSQRARDVLRELLGAD